MLIVKPAKLPAALLLLAMTPALLAAETLRVFAMTYPAWVVRDYQTRPLAPGFELEANDLLRTGTGARLLLQLPDGSALKLGESARLLIGSNDGNGRDEAGFDAGFHLLRGAVRATAGVWENPGPRGRIDFRVGALSSAVNGDDIWGRSAIEGDQLLLLSGEIEVTSGDESPQLLEQPGTWVGKSADEPLSAVNLLERQALQDLLMLTELSEDAGIAAHDGEWHLVLISLTRLAAAEQALQRFRERGYPVWRKSVIRDGRTLHRILLPGFQSTEAALAARATVEAVLGVVDAWVWKAPR